jgi:hypothetical protein
MSEHIFMNNWTIVLSQVPQYALLLVSLPLLTLLTLKVWLSAKSASGKKVPTEWVLLHERDAKGLPLLAKSSSEQYAAKRRNFDMPTRRIHL